MKILLFTISCIRGLFWVVTTVVLFSGATLLMIGAPIWFVFRAAFDSNEFERGM